MGRGQGDRMGQIYSPLIWYWFLKSIFSAGRKMPVWMVGLLDTLCPSQNIYLIGLYCFRKVVPKVFRLPLILRALWGVSKCQPVAVGSQSGTWSTLSNLVIRVAASTLESYICSLYD